MFCVEKGPQACIGLRCDLKLTVFVVYESGRSLVQRDAKSVDNGLFVPPVVRNRKPNMTDWP